MTTQASPLATRSDFGRTPWCWLPHAPPRWKTAVVVWLAIYPTLTLVLALIGPAIQSWPLALRTLATTVVLVPLMVYVLIPTIQRLLARWYGVPKRPAERSPQLANRSDGWSHFRGIPF
jgi:antibiotic biosynthesis monooxygenase (ABM) superfamily enzyme